MITMMARMMVMMMVVVMMVTSHKMLRIRMSMSMSIASIGDLSYVRQHPEAGVGKEEGSDAGERFFREVLIR